MDKSIDNFRYNLVLREVYAYLEGGLGGGGDVCGNGGEDKLQFNQIHSEAMFYLMDSDLLFMTVLLEDKLGMI